MNLYIVKTDRTKEDYYCIANDMNEASDKVLQHLAYTYKSLIAVISVTFVAAAAPEQSPDTFKSQYFLVL